MARKRKRLAITEKTDLIHEGEKDSFSTRKLVEKFKVSKSQVAILLQSKEEVRNSYQESGNVEENESVRLKTTTY